MTNKQKNILFYSAIALFIVSLVFNVIFFNIKTNLRKAEKEYKESIELLNSQKDSLFNELSSIQEDREILERQLEELDEQNSSLKWQASRKSQDNRFLESLVEEMAEQRRKLVAKRDYTDEELIDRIINEYYRDK